MNRHRLILILLLTMGVSSATYGVMFTILDDFRNQLSISESELGLVVAIGFFTSFLGQITLAPLADRGHARRLMIIGLGLEVIGCIGMAQGKTFGAIFVSRLVMGLGAGTALPALRRVIIVADREHFGRNLGRIMSFEVGGFAIGPVLALLIVDRFGIAGPFILLATTILLLIIFLSQTDIPETAAEDHPSERFAIDLLKNRAITSGVLLGVALYAMIGTFDSLWVLMMDDLGAQPWMASLGISVFALPLVLMGPFGGKLVQRIGPFRAGGFGMSLGALFMFGYGIAPTPVAMLLVFLFHTINDGFFVNGAGVAVSASAPLERQAGAQGLLGGFQVLAAGFSASLAGISYDHFGRRLTFGMAGTFMFCLVLGSRIFAGENWHRRNVQPGPPSQLDLIS